MGIFGVIRAILIRIFGKPKAEYPIILGCILLASAIWLLNALNKEYTTLISYPVHFQYDSQRLTPVDELPDKIEVNVTGPGWSLLKRTVGINLKPVVIHPARFSRKKYLSCDDLLPSFISQLPELKVNYVVSDSILVNLNRITSKKVRIRIDTSVIKLAEGYSIGGEILIKPESVQISGASSLVSSFPNELSLELPIKNLVDDFEEAIDIDYRKYNNLKFSNKKILVGFEVGKYFIDTLEMPIIFKNWPESKKQPTDAVAKLIVKCKDIERDSLKQHHIEMEADYKKRKGKVIYLSVQHLPLGVHLLELDPTTVTINEKQ